MEVGSLVELINDNWPWHVSMKGYLTLPVKGVIYTIRGFCPDMEGITLEEIINPPQEYPGGFIEDVFYITRFREVQPPMTIDISELQHQTQTV